MKNKKGRRKERESMKRKEWRIEGGREGEKGGDGRKNGRQINY